MRVGIGPQFDVSGQVGSGSALCRTQKQLRAPLHIPPKAVLFTGRGTKLRSFMVYCDYNQDGARLPM